MGVNCVSYAFLNVSTLPNVGCFDESLKQVCMFFMTNEWFHFKPPHSQRTVSMAQPSSDSTKPNELHIQINKQAGIAQFASGFSVFHVRGEYSFRSLDLPSKLITTSCLENGERTTRLSTDLRNVLYAELLADNVVKIATLARRKKSLSLVFVEGKLRDPETAQTAEAWMASLMSAAYNGEHYCLILVGPRTKGRFNNRGATSQTAQGIGESCWWQGKLQMILKHTNS